MSKQGKLREILKQVAGYGEQTASEFPSNLPIMPPEEAITHIRELIESKKKNLDGRFNWTFQYTFAKKHNQALNEILQELGE